MKIAEVMTQDVTTIDADATVLDAAKRLTEKNIGMLPVSDGERLLGTLTDRDIVVRVVAENRDPAATPVNMIVSGPTKYCFEDEDTEHVAQNMDDLLVRRLPVMSRDKRLVGIVSIDDLRPRK